MGDVFNAAFKRAVALGLLLGVQTFITSSQLGLSDRDALYAGISALITVLIGRGLGEGGYDTNRAASGNANPGDVPVASDKLKVTKVSP